MNSAAPTAVYVPPLLASARRLAAMLDVSEEMVRKMNDAAELPEPVKLGRCVRWRLSDIEAWLDLGRPGRKQFMEIKRGPQ